MTGRPPEDLRRPAILQRGPQPVLAYLIRRLFAAAVMLVVIILVVFGIFFLVPKWPASTSP